jgi:tetratricopeptide (TPR) repeat protein
MIRPRSNVIGTCIGFCGLLLATAASAWAQKTVHCPDGDRIQIDVKEIAIKYDASSFTESVGGLYVLKERFEIVPQKLQEAAVATQQWNELVKGLAAGYNSCAITGQQYADGLNHIYPRLQEDSAGLNAIRKQILAGEKADEKRVQTLIDDFWSNLQQFVQVSHQEVTLQRIEAVSEQIESSNREISGKEDIAIQKADLILETLKKLSQQNLQKPVASPEQIGKEISELHKELSARADAAEQAYNEGYKLLDQFRFREAIPHLQQAVAAVPLPDFYLTLGRAYWAIPDLANAENVSRQGLAALDGKADDKHEARFYSLLGTILKAKPDLPGALDYAQKAFKLDEKTYGPDHPVVAIDMSDIGSILRERGDLDGAIDYTKRALTINERVYGPEHPTVAVDVNNIGIFLLEKGSLDEALDYTKRALKISEKVYGPENPLSASDASNIGQILLEKRDYDGALAYSLRALSIDEKVYGPDHPQVALIRNNIATIYEEKGEGHSTKNDLDVGLGYAKRSLEIYQNAYGPDHPEVAGVASNIAQILQDQGDLDGALRYTQKALEIDEKAYGLEHPMVAGLLNNLGQIYTNKRDLDSAFKYTKQALDITEKIYGPDNPKVATIAGNLGLILQDQGDLDGAIHYAEQALRIFEKVYGPNYFVVIKIQKNIADLKAKKAREANQHNR